MLPSLAAAWATHGLRKRGIIVMNRRLAYVPALGCALALAGCSGMSTTEQRTLSGAAIGTEAGSP